MIKVPISSVEFKFDWCPKIRMIYIYIFYQNDISRTFKVSRWGFYHRMVKSRCHSTKGFVNRVCWESICSLYFSLCFFFSLFFVVGESLPQIETDPCSLNMGSEVGSFQKTTIPISTSLKFSTLNITLNGFFRSVNQTHGWVKVH